MSKNQIRFWAGCGLVLVGMVGLRFYAIGMLPVAYGVVLMAASFNEREG